LIISDLRFTISGFARSKSLPILKPIMQSEVEIPVPSAVEVLETSVKPLLYKS